MNDWLSKIGRVLAVIGGVAFMGGLFFVQCVYPFIRDSSDTWTCENMEAGEYCDDPETIGGFTAAICGRDEVRFTGNVIRTVGGGDPGERVPDTYEFEIKCPGLDLKWEYDNLDDAKYVGEEGAANDQTRLAARLLREYTYGDIDIATARRLLVGE